MASEDLALKIGERATQIYLSRRNGGMTFEQACREAEREFKLENAVPQDIKDIFEGIFK